jgi:endo-1,4-beta-D-glucanase Y
MNALCVLALLLLVPKTTTQTSWPLWTNYVKHFIQQDGRVVDPDRENLTTSEGQSYAMFFALVANDPVTFDRCYQWTVQNLAASDLGQTLPAWSWGRKPDGTFGAKDTNSASDADMWIAYDLIQAGRLWKLHEYTVAGENLLKLIAAKEVSHTLSFPVLLPASIGFEHDDTLVVNVSYMPLFLFQAAAKAQPAGPWNAMAASLPSLVRGSTIKGFATDWLKIDSDGIMSPAPALDSDTEQAKGSYDAIRVYLWAGITPSSAPGREAILKDLSGMTSYMESHALPPEFVTESQPSLQGTGPISYSAALIPFLQASQASEAAAQQQKRLNAAWSARSSLYGEPPRYYDQNLAMFALGFTEHRYHIQNNGDLEVSWQR